MLKCEEQTATVSSVNPRAEIHGEDRVPACDVNIYFETGAKVLDSLIKGLRDAMYTDEDKKAGQQRIPGTESKGGASLRFNGSLGPLSIKKEWPGYKAGIIWGDLAGSVNLELADVKVTKIKVEPKDGGTCGISLQMQCHPQKSDAGELFALVQKEIRLTLTPPSAADLKRIEKEAASKGDGDGDEK